VTLKAKYADFQRITRSRTCETPITTRAEVEEIVNSLVEPLLPARKGIRLMGVTLSALGEKSVDREHQLRLSL
jgi:DNA polymerase IV